MRTSKARRMGATHCYSCGLDHPDFLDQAHIPNREEAPDQWLWLCRLCHWAYDNSLMDRERLSAHYLAVQADPNLRLYSSLSEAIADWKTRNYDPSHRVRDAGKRAGKTRKLSNAAKRAAATRKARRSAGSAAS